MIYTCKIVITDVMSIWIGHDVGVAPRRRDATFRSETLTVSLSRARARVAEGAEKGRTGRGGRGHRAYPSGRSSSFPDNGESAGARAEEGR